LVRLAASGRGCGLGEVAAASGWGKARPGWQSTMDLIISGKAEWV
jgi:hypothetical protein